MTFKISDRGRVASMFRDLFHIDFAQFYDKTVSVIFFSVKIDVHKFDDWLHSVYGEYEEQQNLSMKEVVEQNYGSGAASLIEALL